MADKFLKRSDRLRSAEFRDPQIPIGARTTVDMRGSLSARKKRGGPGTIGEVEGLKARPRISSESYLAYLNDADRFVINNKFEFLVNFLCSENPFKLPINLPEYRLLYTRTSHYLLVRIQLCRGDVIAICEACFWAGLFPSDFSGSAFQNLLVFLDTY